VLREATVRPLVGGSSSRMKTRWAPFVLVLGLASIGAGCAGPDPAVERNVIAVNEASIVERDYRLNPGDELQVTVFQEQGLDH